uniref:NADH dehydrogenase subunit 6 n=1 Tax=Manayunkia occidentalis TaxID=2704156 RepID=UPI00165F86A1|nr:NADH dehydrogenase subunit 6 [Manayunkia occidentalis]QLM00896.1 NADH dehydrogenase subunit 6 [Manayunkia occidentalis]
MFLDMLITLTMVFPISSLIALTPLNLGIWILFTSLIFSFILSLLMSSWFSLSLFLIYIGGMLVMFAYFIAISPNQHIRIMPMLMLSLILSSIINVIFMNFYPNFHMLNMLTLKLPIDTMYFYLNSWCLIFLGLILFLILVAVVKISFRSLGPLRPFNYVFFNS